MKFDKPTLVTVTAPTCSGKSYLLDALTGIDRPLFKRVVSTTTRAPREREIHGVDYYFISREKSLQLEASSEFAELIEFNGTRYGVTNAEMEKAMLHSELPPIIILEPKGLALYEKYCRGNHWEIFKIYVHTPEKVRLDRLNHRTFQDLLKVYNNDRYHLVVQEVINAHTNRLLSIVGDERDWQLASEWDIIVSGEDVGKAIADIEQGITWRNYRNAQVSM